MDKLISADRLKQTFHANVCGGSAYDELIDMQPTIQAIPLDKVKQAREKIQECSYSLRAFSDVFDEDERVVDLDDVFIVLDKLIAESEGKDGSK